MAKDMQRRKFYDAEAAILGPNPPLVPYNELQAFADRITRSRWWGSRQPARRALLLNFMATYNCGQAIGTTTIQLGDNQRTELQLLHALAHCNRTDPRHGHEFALTYLHLVKQFAPALYEPLRAEYRTRNIKRSVKSPATRAAAQERSLNTRFAAAGDRARQLLAELEQEDE